MAQSSKTVWLRTKYNLIFSLTQALLARMIKSWTLRLASLKRKEYTLQIIYRDRRIEGHSNIYYSMSKKSWVIYYPKWVKTSWTYSDIYRLESLLNCQTRIENPTTICNLHILWYRNFVFVFLSIFRKDNLSDWINGKMTERE